MAAVTKRRAIPPKSARTVFRTGTAGARWRAETPSPAMYSAAKARAISPLGKAGHAARAVQKRSRNCRGPAAAAGIQDDARSLLPTRGVRKNPRKKAAYHSEGTVAAAGSNLSECQQNSSPVRARRVTPTSASERETLAAATASTAMSAPTAKTGEGSGTASLETARIRRANGRRADRAGKALASRVRKCAPDAPSFEAPK